MILGITGGSGCGKTTLLKCIGEQGGVVLDCDAIYHRLLREPGLPERIGAAFPGAMEQGGLDRRKLADLVFHDPEALETLNRLTHGAVREAVLQRLAEKPPLAAIDAIALFESGLAELCDVTVAVTAPVEVRVRRLMARDGISRERALARIRAQHEDEWFRSRCTHALENTGSLDGFQAKCVAFLKRIGIMRP